MGCHGQFNVKAMVLEAENHLSDLISHHHGEPDPNRPRHEQFGMDHGGTHPGQISETLDHADEPHPIGVGNSRKEWGPEPPWAHNTEMVLPLAPCNLRAISCALAAGTKRSFLTCLPRLPKKRTSQGLDPPLAPSA